MNTYYFDLLATISDDEWEARKKHKKNINWNSLEMQGIIDGGAENETLGI